MDLLELWIPIIGGGLFFAWAIGAWYGGNKTLSIWLAFTAIVCFLLLGTLQLQNYIKGEPIAESPEIIAQRILVTAQAKSQRAWLTVLPRLTHQIRKGSPISIELVTENVGKEPAIGVNHHSVSMMFDMPEQLDYAPEIWSPQFAEVIRQGCTLAVPANGRATIFPGSKPITPVQWDNVRDIQELVDGKKILVTYGCIGYITANERHFTSYCFFLAADQKSPNIWHFGSAPIGNDAN